MGVYCGTYDTKAFYVDKVMKCSKFMIIQTGLNAHNLNYFQLSGLEFFGRVYGAKLKKLNCFTQKYCMRRISLELLRLIFVVTES